eukprot:COSAG01_NODE_25222_length_752_cov_0.526799_1_plen_86_part_00
MYSFVGVAHHGVPIGITGVPAKTHRSSLDRLNARWRTHTSRTIAEVLGLAKVDGVLVFLTRAGTVAKWLNVELSTFGNHMFGIAT